jgi:hypothetical protein
MARCPAIRTAADYPANGYKRVPDLESALRKCGPRDGMVVSSTIISATATASR